jgi:hypothetical protein
MIAREMDSLIRVPNRGPKSGSQIGVLNGGPKWGSQMGVPNRGIISALHIEVYCTFLTLHTEVWHHDQSYYLHLAMQVKKTLKSQI